MGRITQLDEHLTNMIAAGEVVERPMGIVKELVENSIDAKSKNIEIHILQGGIDTITIIDDGIGMDEKDATLAFERHATSKIKDIDDLWKISTMGFRGEALPSIASVSHVTLNTNNGEVSTLVDIEYGKRKEARPTATPLGTQIDVKNLFQKTPARFKHLKTPQYEFSLISDVVQKFALSHPEISFKLTHDGREIFRSTGNGNLLEVMMQIYGKDAVRDAMKIEGKDNDFKINGFALQPQVHRATKYYMLLFINERMIRSYRLTKAIQDAYAPYIPSDRYPIVVLNLTMDTQLVDVNVHPSKWDIRLSKEKQLEKLIYTTLSNALNGNISVPEIKPKEKVKVEMPTFDLTYETKVHSEINESFIKPNLIHENTIEEKTVTYEPVKNDMISNIRKNISREISEPAFKIEKNEVPLEVQSIDIKEELKKEEKTETKPEIEIKVKNNLPEMEVLSQFAGRYILAQGEAGLYVIDQHAAEERYNYERIREKILNGDNTKQPLLIPLQIDVSMSVIAQMNEINELLKNIGIELEPFGNNSLICRELPVWMKNVNEEKFIQDMLDFYLKNTEINMEKLRKHAIATMACHSSIRFNRNLTIDEMKKVIEDLKQCEQPFHCPHGRPTFILLTHKQLEKDFMRIG